MRILALLTLSTVLWTAGPGLTGNLRTRGVVVANSVPQPDGATVRSGDTIATGSNSLAIIISATHGRIEVRADSEARLGSDSVELARGAVASSLLPVTADRFTVRPQASDRAWYAVARRDGRLLVAAHRGSVLIAAAGVPPILVPEGSYATEDDEPAAAPPPKSKKKKRRTRSAAGAASAGGWTIGGLGHATSVALVVGLSAGVVASTAGVALLNDSNPSPDD
jgi:hypothetical protein